MRLRCKLVTALGVLVVLSAAPSALAFCGFYVARAETGLFNRASQVVITRDGDRTVMTMASDVRGELDEFAVVIPVPTPITREQVNVADKAVIDHLDAYTAPRLVEYFDADPCAPREELFALKAMPMARDGAGAEGRRRADALGVTIEASYTVAEYDILILSARESGGLVRWLRESGYRMPRGAEPIVGSYLRQGMRFFVASVNLSEQRRLGFSYLRPLQVAYESPKFMLPIRLGTVNADGPQELFVYALTRTGRVETTNYRTVRLPSGTEVPAFVKSDFASFYRDMFAEQVRREAMRAVFLEYAWDMAWCDPCAADPLSRDELRQLGVFWLGEDTGRRGPAHDVFVTRLHVRYDAERFPEDLVFQETGDRSNFQGRYVIRHPFRGESSCDAMQDYLGELARRREREARNLAALTGRDIAAIREQMRAEGLPVEPGPRPWWRRIWRR